MKVRIVYQSLFLLFVCVSFCYSEVVHIPDPNLERVIREQLALSEEKRITSVEMEQLRELVATKRDITDLTSLEYATNLRILLVSNTGITDLRPIENLTSLRTLGIWNIPPKDLNLDLQPLTKLINLEFLSLEGIGLRDISVLSNLTNLRKLHLRRNLILDHSPVLSLPNLVEFWYDEVCSEPPLMPVEDRIENRNFPSTVSFLAAETDDEVKYDFNYDTWHGLSWDTTPSAPTHGLATQLAGKINFARETRQRLLQENPNMLFIRELRLYNHRPSNGMADAFPEGSDLWLRDASGNIVENSAGAYLMDFLNPKVQDLLIERIVGFAECGLFDGILIDSLRNHAFGGAADWLDGSALTDEEMETIIIEAHLRIFREVRARVRDDFLIIANANDTKLIYYAEYINGSAMEINPDWNPNQDFAGEDATYKILQRWDGTLLWNEKHLRKPIINWGDYYMLPTEQPYSPINLQRMRLATTRTLTLSDGYVRYGYRGERSNYWYDFWDADLGRPVGGNETKGQTYNDIEGLFIREFTNGWAIYNRSGEAQTISLPQETTGVASGLRDTHHTIPDLDGEIYLKSTGEVADLNGDGVVNILDLVLVANAFGGAEPDLNGDGVVNIQDLVIVANAF